MAYTSMSSCRDTGRFMIWHLASPSTNAQGNNAWKVSIKRFDILFEAKQSPLNMPLLLCESLFTNGNDKSKVCGSAIYVLPEDATTSTSWEVGGSMCAVHLFCFVLTAAVSFHFCLSKPNVFLAGTEREIELTSSWDTFLLLACWTHSGWLSHP